jgi:hypothetical protein
VARITIKTTALVVLVVFVLVVYGVPFSSSLVIDSAVNGDPVKIMVNSNPTVSVQPYSWTMDAGQSKTFTAITGDGTLPYSYVWSIDYVAQPGTNSSTFVYAPSTLGSHILLVAVTDSVGGQVASYANVNVSSTLLAPIASASKGNIDQGDTLFLNSTAISTGTAPYGFQWLKKAPEDSGYSNITGATSSTYYFSTSTSTASGSWSFEVQVTDSASQPVTVTSNPMQITVLTPIPEISSGLVLLLFVVTLSSLALIFTNAKQRKHCK